jgi:hypothetical protein
MAVLALQIVAPIVDVAFSRVEPTPPSILIDTINGHLASETFSCLTNPLFNPVKIEGSGAGNGQVSNFDVEINWGDGTIGTTTTIFDPPSGNNNFTFDFSGTYSYQITTDSTYEVVAKLYHGGSTGNDHWDSQTIPISVCVVSDPPATLTVVKHVESGTALASEFNLHVKINDQEFGDSPNPGSETGTVYTVPAGTYVISEDPVSGYYSSFSGDCDSSGSITLASGENKTCIITNSDNEAPIDGGWTDWTPVNENICGTVVEQTRTCTNPAPANGGADCVGESSQTITNPSCPIDGGWSEWSEKSDLCGATGTQTRTCTNPAPAYGGADCVGESSQSYTNDPCPPGPIDGGWTDWTPVNENICGTVVEQTRTCTNPAPANGGADCVGESSQTITNPSCQTTGGGGGTTSSSGGGGGNGAPLTLMIIDVRVTDVTQTTATITWLTNYESTSQVLYAGPDEAHTLNMSDNTGTPPLYGYAHTTLEDTNKVTYHTITITGLTPDTPYYFMAVSHGSLAFSSESNFKTLPVGEVLGASTVAGSSDMPSEEGEVLGASIELPATGFSLYELFAIILTILSLIALQAGIKRYSLIRANI